MDLAVQRAFNEKENKRRAKEEAKRQEEEQRKMAEMEKREEERRKQREEHYKNLPENQLQMLLYGTHYECGHHHMPMDSEDFCRISNCPSTRGRDIEPGRMLLAKEYSMGKIIRLDDKTRNRLVEFAIPDETYIDLINRLLDIAAAAKEEAK